MARLGGYRVNRLSDGAHASSAEAKAAAEKARTTKDPDDYKRAADAHLTAKEAHGDAADAARDSDRPSLAGGHAGQAEDHEREHLAMRAEHASLVMHDAEAARAHTNAAEAFGKVGASGAERYHLNKAEEHKAAAKDRGTSGPKLADMKQHRLVGAMKTATHGELAEAHASLRNEVEKYKKSDPTRASIAATRAAAVAGEISKRERAQKDERAGSGDDRPRDEHGRFAAK